MEKQTEILPRNEGEVPLYNGRFLKLKQINWIDTKYNKRKWETLERTNHTDIGCDAVDLIALLKRKDFETEIVLIKIYRVPIGRWCIEFPAGLVELSEKDNLPGAALRELKEETGYTGKVVAVQPPHIPLWGAPAITNISLHYIVIEINGDDDENKNPKQHLEGGETIQVHTVPLSKLYSSLLEWQNQGVGVASAIFTFALGKEMGI